MEGAKGRYDVEQISLCYSFIVTVLAIECEPLYLLVWITTRISTSS